MIPVRQVFVRVSIFLGDAAGRASFRVSGLYTVFHLICILDSYASETAVLCRFPLVGSTKMEPAKRSDEHSFDDLMLLVLIKVMSLNAICEGA